MELDLPLTGVGIAVCVALAVLFGWLGARPLDITKGPRMVPWRFFMLLCVAAAIVLLVHLLTVVGFKTETPQY